MKKIIYAITKLTKEGNQKVTGQGYITDTDIIIACVSTKGKPYIKVFENAVECCHKCIGDENQYKGAYTEYVEAPFENKYGSIEVKEIGIDYFIWYRVVAE